MKNQKKKTIDERIREKLIAHFTGDNRLLTETKHIDEVIDEVSNRIDEYSKSFIHIAQLVNEESKTLQAALAHRAEALSLQAELSYDAKDIMTLVNNLDVFLAADLDFLVKHLTMADDAALLIALEFNPDLRERLQDIIGRVNEVEFEQKVRRDQGLKRFLSDDDRESKEK